MSICDPLPRLTGASSRPSKQEGICSSKTLAEAADGRAGRIAGAQDEISTALRLSDCFSFAITPGDSVICDCN